MDWDLVFDAPGSGLVARIEEARSAQDLQQAMQLILQTLFNREGDAERRAVFTNLVNEILADAKKTKNSVAAVMAEVKARVIQILHSIKEDRLKRARKALAAKALKARESEQSAQSAAAGPLGYDDRQPDQVHITVPKVTAASGVQPTPADDELIGDQPAPPGDELIGEQNDDDFNAWLDSSSSGNAAEAYEDTGGSERKSPEDFFADVIITSILNNLAALGSELKDRGSDTEKLPFVLSPAFATRLEPILRTHVLPGFTEGSYFTISQMSGKPRAQWLSSLTEIFSDPTQGLMLWERWQIAWRNATTQRDEPPPPFVDPAKQGIRGVMNRLLGSDDVFIEDVEMTQEEWQEAVEEARQENLRSREVWSLLKADSPDYQAPFDTDNHLLMTLFRSDEDMKIHVAKLRQFAKDSETAGRKFDTYLQGKDLDLPLLCACYNYPDELMSGEKAMVATFVAGLNRKQAEIALPLCCRFLGTAMGNRFAEE